MFKGSVEGIFICHQGEKPMNAVTEVRAITGRGLEGDRYFLKMGTYSKKDAPERNVTLIEAEAIEAVAREAGIPMNPGESRRNIVTRGVPLNHLVGKTFSVGQAIFRGIRLCEPCSHLDKLTGKALSPILLHRGGLRAEIITDGTLRVGDEIAETQQQT